MMRKAQDHPAEDLARHPRKRLLLINPRNPLVKLTSKSNRWNKYRVWKPLGLLVLAGLTPRDWHITVIDENVETPDYSTLPRPDLVGVTAFTSQAPRAYTIAAGFRARGIPVVMGGIHATVRQDEVASRVDALVTGEAESVWAQVLQDAAGGALKPVYAGALESMENTPAARHDLLPTGYYFGSIQTTRGCPLELQLLQRERVQRTHLPATPDGRRHRRVQEDQGKARSRRRRQPDRHPA